MQNVKKTFFFGSLLTVLLSGIFSACDPMAGCGDVALESTLLEGQITSYDARDCICCGGWYLETADQIFNFDNLPDGSSVQLEEEKLPIKVKFDFTEMPNACNDKGLKVVLTTIELQ